MPKVNQTALAKALKELEPGAGMAAVVAACRTLAEGVDEHPLAVDLWREYRLMLKMLVESTVGEADAGLADALAAVRASVSDGS